MNVKELKNLSADLFRDMQNRCVEIFAQYLQSIGGSIDVSFRLLSCQNDTCLEESIPFQVELSRVFIDISPGKEEVCVTTAHDGEDWLMTEYLTIDEMISLMDYIASNK